MFFNIGAVFRVEFCRFELKIGVADDVVRYRDDRIGARHFLFKLVCRQVFVRQALQLGEQVIVQAINNEPLTLTRLANRFGVEDMLSTVKDTRFMISLLYYFGILTLNGETEWGEFCFKIPNLVVRSLYVERLFDRLLPQEEREDVQLMAKLFKIEDLP